MPPDAVPDGFMSPSEIEVGISENFCNQHIYKPKIIKYSTSKISLSRWKLT